VYSGGGYRYPPSYYRYENYHYNNYYGNGNFWNGDRSGRDARDLTRQRERQRQRMRANQQDRRERLLDRQEQRR
jgi:hypothetical protein